MINESVALKAVNITILFCFIELQKKRITNCVCGVINLTRMRIFVDFDDEFLP